MTEHQFLEQSQNEARAICNQAAIPMTLKRLEVYTALLKVGQPVSAYDLIDFVNRDFGRNITPISVYRMLDFLEQKHLVRKLRSTGKYLALVPTGEHDAEKIPQYLVCRECGDVKEHCVDEKILTELKSRIEASGFQLRNLELELDCLCAPCLEKNK